MDMTITVLWDVMLCGLVFQHYAASHSLIIIHAAVYSHTLTAVPALQLFAVLNV